MFYSVYIIQSKSTGRRYIGHTHNIEERLKRHNENRERATKYRGPYQLIYEEKFYSRKEATKRERYLKSLKGKLVKILSNSVGA